LASTLLDLEASINAPLALEGLSVRGDEIALLGLMPHDERTRGYTFAWGFALTAIGIAERHGGRVYSTGRYFGDRAERVLGHEHVAALRASKATHDPFDILNPGKVVFGNGAIGAAIRCASRAEPLVRRVARAVGQPTERTPVPADDFRAQVAERAYACAQCGYCVVVCPQFQESVWETHGPLGKWSFLKAVMERRDSFDNEMMDTFAMCVGCGKCDPVCQVELPILATWEGLRQTIMRGVLTRSS
jgi:ferredoxin